MTEEVCRNWVILLNLSRKNFTALKLKNFNDEINNLMNGYCSKIRNYVKLFRKVGSRLKPPLTSRHWSNQFGQKIMTDFGHPYLTDFGQTDFGQF